VGQALSQTTARAALSFHGVTKIYSRSHLGRTTLSRGVEDLSFSVEEGEAFGLLGLNGSGKTTAFKLALGLLNATSGSVSLLGGRPCEPSALRRVGYLPELPYFYSYLTPRESLRFYGRLSGLGGKALEGRIDEVLELVHLCDNADRKMGEFSKGMIQRAGLAQAVLHEPRLLVLDEPVSGLDPLAIKEFRDLLQGLGAAGTTILLSSHSISEVERLCQRVGILKDGRLKRVLAESEWRNGPGLEALFVEAVR
jgi:ABC-2 type transport system ATP-binding protein